MSIFMLSTINSEEVIIYAVNYNLYTDYNKNNHLSAVILL